MGVSGGFVGRFNLQFQGERVSVQHARSREAIAMYAVLRSLRGDTFSKFSSV